MISGLPPIRTELLVDSDMETVMVSETEHKQLLTIDIVHILLILSQHTVISLLPHGLGTRLVESLLMVNLGSTR